METLNEVEDYLAQLEQAHQADIKAVKRTYNQTVLQRTDRQLVDIRKNYDMGIITMEQLFAQQHDILSMSMEEMYKLKE